VKYYAATRNELSFHVLEITSPESVTVFEEGERREVSMSGRTVNDIEGVKGECRKKQLTRDLARQSSPNCLNIEIVFGKAEQDRLLKLS